MDKVFVGSRVSALDTGGSSRPVSRVVLRLDGETCYAAGDDTGRTLEKTCPWGTQAMAEAILDRLRGVDYRLFSGEDALLDPAAELGDGVTAGGVYSVLARADITFDGHCTADIAAPGGDEAEDEYPYRSRARREAERQLARTYSRITKTAEQIRLEVASGLEGLSASITVELDKIVSTVQGQGNQISSIKQYVDNITLSVSNGSTRSTITLKSGSAAIASQTIEMRGLVSFTGLASGTTTIDGACIKTGTIDAEYLNLTGAIRWRDLSSSVQNDINDAYSMAEDAQALAGDLDGVVGGWTYRGSTYIDGSKIMAGTVMASQLLGGEVGLLDSRESMVGGLLISSTQTGYGVELYTDYGGIRISSGGNFWVDSQYGSLGLTSSGVVCGDDCVPMSSGGYSLGRGGLRWSDVYADNDTIQTSDREKKEAVAYGLEPYAALFDALRPVRYRLKAGRSGRTHLGLIAQDVEAALAASGLTGRDFAGFVKSPREGGGYDYALRYGEFLPLCIWKLQRLEGRVEELERRLTT